MSVQDRHYQAAAVDGAFARWEAGDAATLIVLPTGTGKTIVAGQAARRARDEHGRKTLFLAHREELILQAVDKLGHVGLTAAIEMAGQRADRHAALFGDPDVVVGTVQTLQGPRLDAWPKGHFGLIITDEAHHARAASYQRIYDHFSGCWHLGITATPDRGDRANLGAVYESLAYEYSLRRAIIEGYLCPLSAVKCETPIDLRGIRTTGGDYNQGDLEERIGPLIEELADGIVQELLKDGEKPDGNARRSTVVFTPDVGSAKLMAQALRRNRRMSVPAISVDGEMPRADRRQALELFNKGEYQAICCCDLLIEGWDCPRVACVAVCRPTKKRARYAQMIGRGTRTDEGKTDCLIVDFAWETTNGHDLVKATDLFDDSKTDDTAIDLAGEIVDAGLTDNLLVAVELAEGIIAGAAEARRRYNVALDAGEIVAVAAGRLKAGLDDGPRAALLGAIRQIVEGRLAAKQAADREDVAATRRELAITDTGRRAAYRRIVYDPVGVTEVMGIPLKRGWDFDAGSTCTGKQADLLRKLGFEEPAGLSRMGASKALDHLLGRLRKGKATVKQVGALLSFGVEPADARDMSFTEASTNLDRLFTHAKAQRRAQPSRN